MSLLDPIFGKRSMAGAKGSRPDDGINCGTTFAVSHVTPATQPLQVIPHYDAVTEFLGGQVEACSQYHGQLVAGVQQHPLIETLHLAFATHRPISLSPDIIWLTLTQGLAQHINTNAESLRQHFVRHEGKLKISVRRDDFVKGSPENPWPEVFSQFSAAIHNHIGDAHDLIVADFSTTGPVERAASEIVLMDAMQPYFTYELITLCGIPSITIEGTREDWQSIADRASKFRRFDLDWWVNAIDPLLNQFVAAASGKVDRTFWDSIYKWHGAEGSGTSSFVTGWILNFFPYLSPVIDHADFSRETSAKTFCRNPWINRPPSKVDGPDIDRIPRLPPRAPFLWKYLKFEYEMEFIGGLMGVRQDVQTLCLRPEIGWAVWEKGAQQRKSKADAAEAEEKRRKAAEKAAQASAERNLEANRRFANARKLGFRIHELYLNSTVTSSGDDLDVCEQNQLLLDLARAAYQTSNEFHELWDVVHGEPPAPSHTKWLSLWKRNLGHF